MLSFIILYGVLLVCLLACSFHVYSRRTGLDDMHGMMVGMTFGMLAGLVTATLYVIPTGDFLWGVISGSIIGLVFGVPLGRLGGHLGVMEGVMAGPMGGMMGAMLGQMIRPFNLAIFMPFFVVIVLLTLVGLAYTVYCKASCCGKPATTKTVSVHSSFVVACVFACVVVLGASLFLPFSLSSTTTANTVSASTPPTSISQIQLPPGLQAFAQDKEATATMNNGLQEVTVFIRAAGYDPNVIHAKKGRLRITFTAEKDSGCAREVVFPAQGIDKIVPELGSETVDLDLVNEGIINFRCSMDMMHGRIVVK